MHMHYPILIIQSVFNALYKDVSAHLTLGMAVPVFKRRVKITTVELILLLVSIVRALSLHINTCLNPLLVEKEFIKQPILSYIQKAYKPIEHPALLGHEHLQLGINGKCWYILVFKLEKCCKR